MLDGLSGELENTCYSILTTSEFLGSSVRVLFLAEAVKKAQEEGIRFSRLADRKRDAKGIKIDLKELEKALQTPPAGQVTGLEVLRQEDVRALSQQITQLEAKLAELEASAAQKSPTGGGETKEQEKRLQAASGAVLKLQRMASLLDFAEIALEHSVTFYRERGERAEKDLPKDGETAAPDFLQTQQAEVQRRRRLFGRARRILWIIKQIKQDVVRVLNLRRQQAQQLVGTQQ
ncbi:UNVERIFIED_CONTAM: hypothetical protein HHA_237810 [Hammondia hammondi]|eukprot:XP_008888212.1 hypothetical protein HHA_237810 [Hammondia hammondi]